MINTMVPKSTQSMYKGAQQSRARQVKAYDKDRSHNQGQMDSIRRAQYSKQAHAVNKQKSDMQQQQKTFTRKLHKTMESKTFETFMEMLDDRSPMERAKEKKSKVTVNTSVSRKSEEGRIDDALKAQRKAAQKAEKKAQEEKAAKAAQDQLDKEEKKKKIDKIRKERMKKAAAAVGTAAGVTGAVGSGVKKVARGTLGVLNRAKKSVPTKSAGASSSGDLRGPSTVND